MLKIAICHSGVVFIAREICFFRHFDEKQIPRFARNDKWETFSPA